MFFLRSASALIRHVVLELRKRHEMHEENDMKVNNKTFAVKRIESFTPTFEEMSLALRQSACVSFSTIRQPDVCQVLNKRHEN